jgi:hypothetical protein
MLYGLYQLKRDTATDTLRTAGDGEDHPYVAPCRDSPAGRSMVNQSAAGARDRVTWRPDAMCLEHLLVWMPLRRSNDGRRQAVRTTRLRLGPVSVSTISTILLVPVV